MPELIERDALKNHLYRAQAEAFKRSEWYVAGSIQSFIDLLDKQTTIEAEPVRHGKSCEYCKGRSYTKKPLTVITRTMKRVEVCFNFCPNCGRDMRATDTNVVKGGADNG